MVAHWVSKYVGLPFEKYNCWQLMCLIYKNEFNIILPDFSKEYSDAMDREKIKQIYNRELQGRFVKLEEQKLYGFVVLRMSGQPWHCGLVVDQNIMLHTERKVDAVIENFSHKLWRARLIGFYEYNQRS